MNDEYEAHKDKIEFVLLGGFSRIIKATMKNLICK